MRVPVFGAIDVSMWAIIPYSGYSPYFVRLAAGRRFAILYLILTSFV